MEEMIKTARAVHRALIMVCAAMLLFAISPDQSARYRSAITDLELLAQASSEFGNFNSETRALLERDINHRMGNWKYRNQSKSKTPVSIVVPSHQFIRFQPAPDLGTISELTDYLYSNSLSRKFVADRDDDAVQDDQPAGDSVPPPVPAPGADVEPPPRFDSITFNRFESTPDSDRAHLYGEWKMGGDTIASSQISGRFTVEPESSYRSHLTKMDKRFALHAVDEIRKPDSLPGLQGVWDEIRGRTLNDAFSSLAEKEQQNQQTLSLLGIPVQRAIVLYAGPAILLALILYLTAYIGHLSSQLSESKSDSTAKGAGRPWIAVFPGVLPATLSILSILVLSPVATWALATRATGQSLSLVTSILTLVILAAAIVATWQLIKLRAAASFS